MKISDKSAAKHYKWGNDCDSWILVDTFGLSVKQESMPIGREEKLHKHHFSQQYFYVLAGCATFFVDGDTITVEAEQGLLIPAGKPHYIKNASEQQLDFLVISQPSTEGDRKDL
jgi:mannose-6-phosphate isomerase-like protein (cupin superfamily)